MKNLSILSLKLFIFIFVFLRKMRQYICSSICLILTIINKKIVPEELLGPTDLFRAETLYIHKVAKVVVIGKHKNFVFATFWIMKQYFEYFNNCQKLTVVNLISSFGYNHFSQEIYYQMPLNQIIQSQLTEDFANSIAGHVSFNLDIKF